MTIGERNMNMFFLRVFDTNREKCKRVQSLQQSSIKESILIKDTGPCGQVFMDECPTSPSHTPPPQEREVGHLS